MNRRLWLLGASAALAGCAGPDVARYAAEKPGLDLREYFNGRIDGWGLFTGRNDAAFLLGIQYCRYARQGAVRRGGPSRREGRARCR